MYRGMPVTEALAMGRPAIVTGWSGTWGHGDMGTCMGGIFTASSIYIHTFRLTRGMHAGMADVVTPGVGWLVKYQLKEASYYGGCALLR